MGTTTGTFAGAHNSGSHGAFVRRHAPGGGVVWTHQSETVESDEREAVDARRTGVYVGGHTAGPLTGQRAPDETDEEGDAFLRRVVSYRLDASLSAGHGNGYVGNDVYNASGAGQAKAVSKPHGTRQVFYVRAENDGDTSDGYAVDGCSSNASFIVRCFAGAGGDTEITRAACRGISVLSNSAPQGNRVVRAIMTVRDAASSDAVLRCAITPTSNNRPAFVDQVAPIVRVP